MTASDAVKVDNENLASKLAVRRYILRRYHVDGDIRVFDACQGDGVIWRELRKEFEVTSYWGADLKRKSGRLFLDSVRLIEGGLTENVIDVDTYGSPWSHWLALLPRVKSPTSVFLTVGLKSARAMRLLSAAEADALGIGRLFSSTPAKLRLRMAHIMFDQMLSRAELLGIRIVDAVEGARGHSARYLGLRLEPDS